MSYYFGVFIECKNRLVEKNVEYFDCSQCKTENGNFIIYCSMCGMKLEKYMVKKQDNKIDYQQIYDIIIDKYNESLTKVFLDNDDEETDYFINNVNVDCHIKHYPKEYVDSDILIMWQENFLNHFKDEINDLKNLYGDENVSIHIGFLNHYLS